MANKNSATDVSTNKDVTQRLFWDKDTQKIEVYHEINIQEGSVYRKSINTYENGTEDFGKWTEEYGDGKEKFVTVYEYIKTNEGPDKPQSLLFPENGGYYPLEDGPHLVIAIMTPTGENSTAAGEAL
jgi:hypothetical protein